MDELGLELNGAMIDAPGTKLPQKEVAVEDNLEDLMPDLKSRLNAL